MTIVSKPTHSIPLTARESLAQRIPILLPMLADAAAELRGRGWDDQRIVTQFDLYDVEAVQRFLDLHAAALSAVGRDGDVDTDTSLLARHVWDFLNFELHHRKLFWVDESLAWMLAETRLDIEGRDLRLPFPSFAIAFTDRGTLELAEACLQHDDESYLRGATLRILTVHVTAVPTATDDTQEIDLTLFFDDGGGRDWPYIIGRALRVQASDHLDEILVSRFPDVDPDAMSKIFQCEELRRLVHLVINAILFTTSCQEPWRVLASPITNAAAKATGWGKGRKARLAKLRHERSSEEVFHLPGKIPIAQVRTLREARRGEGQLFARFMVRGHWRRAQAGWDDSRMRWIEPYWKGPDMATVVEREYVLKK